MLHRTIFLDMMHRTIQLNTTQIEVILMNTEKINKALAPAVEFNRLVLNNMKTVFSMQTESLKAYAELGFKNLNDGLDVKNVEDLKTYAESQQNVIKEVSEQVTRDLEALGEMNARFVEEARKLSVNK